MEQAKFEFGIEETDWTSTDSLESTYREHD